MLAVAASVAGTRPLGATGRQSGAVPHSLVNYTLVILAVLGVGVFAVVVRYIPLLSDERALKRRSFAVRILLGTGIVFLVIGVIAIIVRHFNLGKVAKQRPPGSGVLTPGAGGPGGSFHWAEILLIVGFGGLLVLLSLASRHGATGPRTGGGAGDETLAEAIRESIEDLRSDPDLRRAIVAAYARMERALAATGVPRHPAEAPREYLERALLAVDASAGSARRLTELFERAKFSHHEPDSRMRDDAIDALLAIRDDLWAASEVAA